MLHRANLLRGLGGSSTSCVVTCVGRPTVVTSSWVYARFSWPDRLVAWLSRACSFFDPRNDRLSISCLSSSSFRLRSCSYTIKSSVYLSSFIQRDSKEKKHPSYPLKISRRSIIKSNPKINDLVCLLDDVVTDMESLSIFEPQRQQISFPYLVRRIVMCCIILENIFRKRTIVPRVIRHQGGHIRL